MRPFANTIPANDRVPIKAPVFFVYLNKLSKGVTLEWNGGQDRAPVVEGDRVPMRRIDDQGNVVPVTDLALVNNSGSNIDAEVIAGLESEAFQSDRAYLQTSPPGSLTTTADQQVAGGGTAQILAANADRKTVTIRALAANPGNCRVGDSNVAASRGLPVAPGESVTLEVTAAIHAHNPNGSPADFAILETAT